MAMPALALVFGLVLTGCATGGPGKRDPNTPHGLLTITDIPAAYAGKLASAELDSPAARGYGTVTAAVGDKTVITNGEVTMPLYNYTATSGAYLGYTGNGSLEIDLDIRGSFDITTFVFKKKVQFENGVAKVSWNDSVKAWYNLTLTITGIPSEYIEKNDIARITKAGEKLSHIHHLDGFSDNFTLHLVRQGDGLTLSLTDDGRWQRNGRSSKHDYTGGPIDVGIDAFTEDRMDQIVFRGVVFTDGKATVHFQQGVKLRQTPLDK